LDYRRGWAQGLNDGPIGVVEDGAWESVHALEGGTVIAEADGGGDAFVDGFVSDIGGARGTDGECIGGEVKGGEMALAEKSKAGGDEFGILATFAGGRRSHDHGFEKKEEAQEWHEGEFGEGEDGGVTARGEVDDMEEGEVGILEKSAGAGVEFVIEGVAKRWRSELAGRGGEPL
jgi:hypothetical protein